MVLFAFVYVIHILHAIFDHSNLGICSVALRDVEFKLVVSSVLEQIQ